jgi:SAM-dependent methyltransferase
MIRFDSPLKNAAFLVYRWMKPIVDPVNAAHGIRGYIHFIRDWISYGRLEGAEPRRLLDTAPNVLDNTSTTPFDRHYFYQNVWAFRKIKESGVPRHVDVASQIPFVSFLTAICDITFIDIRPLEADLPHFDSRPGSVLAMPYPDGSIQSLSCLHVAEHIGLGRYGDPLDPHGTRKACAELSRVLAPGGSLYFSMPIGVPRLCFNAHRIHSTDQVRQYFQGLRLVELSGIGDNRRFHSNIDPALLDKSSYACGLFHFTKD